MICATIKSHTEASELPRSQHGHSRIVTKAESFAHTSATAVTATTSPRSPKTSSKMQTVHLNDDEASSFLEWRKQQNNWEILMRAGIFTIRNGSAEIHFNHNGDIASVDQHLMTFRRVKVVIPTDPLASSEKPHIM